MFFRKKHAHAQPSACDAATVLLLVQKTFAGRALIEDDNGVNRHALGYIRGFIGAAIRASGGNPSDKSVYSPVMIAALNSLFPGKGHWYLDLIERLMEAEDEVLIEAALCGAVEFLKSLNRKDGDPHPFRLGEEPVAQRLNPRGN